jgi:DNA replication and repair protein RecF
MYLKSLSLLQFKNHDEFKTEFSAWCNCIVGENGSGKTSLLDAIHYVTLTKSFLSNQDSTCVQHQQEYFMIKANIAKQDSENEVVCSFSMADKKQILIDKKPIEKMSEHIGRYPLVLLAPTDTDLVRDGSELRRKFFDSLISQLDGAYLAALIQYNRLLLQRNAVLKQFAERNYYDHALLETYSEPMLTKGLYLNQLRTKYIAMFLPLFQENYQNLSENREQVGVTYLSEVGQEQFEAIFRDNYRADLAASRSTKGVHKDDFDFVIDQLSLKKYGSQGQQKAFVMALKLAQFALIQQIKGIKPILLMDDIFDKLDERRINMLLGMIENGSFGQVFITDARPERSRALLARLGQQVSFVEL